MYSVCDTLAGGFPHSEISGSKLICQLPEAYRRLSRPSSPVIAKASTTCTYSLDPITLMSFRQRHRQGISLSEYFALCRLHSLDQLLDQEMNILVTQSIVASGTVRLALDEPNTFRRQR